MSLVNITKVDLYKILNCVGSILPSRTSEGAEKFLILAQMIWVV
jgi:hypothetical protein